MKITQAVRIRGRQYRLSFEDAPDAVVDIRTFDESPYRVGCCLSDEQWQQLCSLSEQNRLRERALYLLSCRSYSKTELARKLSRPRSGPAPSAEQAAAVSQRMEQVGLVDDGRYALQAARDMQKYKCFPRRRIAAELSAKGIDRETVQSALDALEAEDSQIALALLEKKYSHKLSTAEDCRRTADALLRRGFCYHDVRTAMQNCCKSIQGTDEEWQ